MPEVGGLPHRSIAQWRSCRSTSSRDVQARTDLYVETGDRSYGRLPRTPTPVGHHARRTLNAPWITPRSTSR